MNVTDGAHAEQEKGRRLFDRMGDPVRPQYAEKSISQLVGVANGALITLDLEMDGRLSEGQLTALGEVVDALNAIHQRAVLIAVEAAKDPALTALLEPVIHPRVGAVLDKAA